MEKDEYVETNRSGCGVFKASTETDLDVHVNDCHEQTQREVQQQMMSPSLNSKPKPPKMRYLADIYKQLDAICGKKLPMEEDKMNGEEFQKSNYSTSKRNIEKNVTKKTRAKMKNNLVKKTSL